MTRRCKAKRVKCGEPREISEENRASDRLRMPVPTRALPGTAEKLAVLAARAANYEHLFHPADATLDNAVGVVFMGLFPSRASHA